MWLGTWGFSRALFTGRWVHFISTGLGLVSGGFGLDLEGQSVTAQVKSGCRSRQGWLKGAVLHVTRTVQMLTCSAEAAESQCRGIGTVESCRALLSLWRLLPPFLFLQRCTPMIFDLDDLDTEFSSESREEAEEEPLEIPVELLTPDQAVRPQGPGPQGERRDAAVCPDRPEDPETPVPAQTEVCPDGPEDPETPVPAQTAVCPDRPEDPERPVSWEEEPLQLETPVQPKLVLLNAFTFVSGQVRSVHRAAQVQAMSAMQMEAARNGPGVRWRVSLRGATRVQPKDSEASGEHLS